MDQRCDKDLVSASCRGDKTAYAVLVERHYDRVFLVCLGVLGNVHDAEDIAQDAMIAGFQKVRQLKDAGQFGHWLAKIARNLSINFVRKRAAAGKALGRRLSETARHDSPGDDVQEAVARLPLDLRLPLVMYYFDGRSVKTVAETLEISTSGVYAKLRNAISELHEILTTQGDP